MPDLKSAVLDQDELLAESLDILAKIEAIEGSQIPEDIHLLKMYRRKYNQTMGYRMQLDAGELIDPIKKLPSDIFRDIIHDAATCLRGPFSDVTFESSMALLLTLVSAKWRDAILDMPLLWSYIEVSPSVEDLRAKVALSLELSSNVPLHLDLSYPVGEWDAILPVILDHRHRVHGVSLNNRIYSSIFLAPDERFDERYYPLQQLLPLPNLIRFYSNVKHTRDPDSPFVLWILRQCSNLRDISGIRLTNDILRLDSIHKLERIEEPGDTSIEEIFSLQKNLPRLIHFKSSPILLPIGLSEQQRDLSNSDEGSLIPLTWKYLDFSSSRQRLSSQVLQRLINLVRLEIQVLDGSLRPLLSHLHELASLEILVLVSSLPTDVQIDLPPVVEIIPNPSTVTLDFRMWTVGGRPSTKTFKKSSVRLQECLIRGLPSLRDVTLRMMDVPPSMKFYDNKSLPQLLRFALWGRYYSFPISSENGAGIGPIITDFLLFNILPETWEYVSSQNVTRLDVALLYYGSLTEKIQTVDAKNWPSLLSLSIFGPYPYKQDLGFLHLRTLELRTGNYPLEPLGDSADRVTLFCYELAISPSKLPSLENLSFRDITHWDILFLLLKRRNITRMKGVNPIKILGIATYHAKELIRPINQLLNGEFPDTAILFDYSIHGALRVVKDMSTPGCQSCLYSFRPCQAGPSAASNAKQLDLTPYPLSENEILSTWEKRNRFWRDEILLHTPRVRKCSTHYEYKKLTLTGNYCPGE